jgi:hypothetical protein
MLFNFHVTSQLLTLQHILLEILYNHLLHMYAGVVHLSDRLYISLFLLMAFLAVTT